MSARVLRLAALIAIAAPLVGLTVLMFGGATIGSCHATVGDGSPRPACPIQVAVWPPMRTNAGIALGLIAAGTSWLISTGVVLAHVMTSDRQRIARLGVGIVVIGVAVSGVGFLIGLTVRLRHAAENGITWGLAGLVLGWFLAVAWVGLRPGVRSPPSSQLSLGRPGSREFVSPGHRANG